MSIRELVASLMASDNPDPYGFCTRRPSGGPDYPGHGTSAAITSVQSFIIPYNEWNHNPGCQEKGMRGLYYCKSKCAPQTIGICQRCSRLGKQCKYLSLPQTKRRIKNRSWLAISDTNDSSSSSRRGEALEKRLAHLVSQIATLKRQSERPAPDISDLYIHDDAGYDSTGALLLGATKDTSSHGLEVATTSILADEPSIVDRGLMNESEAELLLRKFRINYLPKFPFVVIAHTDTETRLRDQEPFLLLCIISVTISSSHSLYRTVADGVMRHVTRIVARSERNLELLRGLLIHSAYGVE